MNTISLNDLIAAVASTYGNFAPALNPYVYLLIGTVITFVVVSFAVGLFKIKNGRSAMKQGYYTNGKYDDDQELGKMEYDIQTKGIWIK
jgi:hypothetical protein